jgi:hypothetical protein
MLVVAWITVVSAAIDLVALPGGAALLESVTGLAGSEWAALMAVSLLTKGLDLVFWAWVIHTLQFDPAVRDAFLCAARDPAHA